MEDGDRHPILPDMRNWKGQRHCAGKIVSLSPLQVEIVGKHGQIIYWV